MNSTEKWDNWLNIRLNKRQIVPSNQKPAQPILFIIHDIYLSGSQLFLVRFLEWIKQNQPLPLEITIGISRNEIGVYGDGGKFILDRLEKCGVVHFVNPHTKLPENVDAIRGGNYSLIYVNTCTLGGLLNSIGKINTPIIVHVHELSFWIKYKLGIEKFNLLLEYNPHWIACSNAVKNNLLNFCNLPSQKIEVIHEFIPFVDDLSQQSSLRQKVRKELKIAENTFVLASCGTIDWRKGGDLLIPLVVLLQKKLPHHNFVCIWIGSLTTEVENEMRYVIEQAGIQQNIMLLGSKTNALDYMSAADAFLLLSREDPFPLVMLEAGACRLPVIAFDGSGGASEFVESDAGMLAPYLDLEAMAQNVVRLFENTELRKSMGDRAYAKVKNLYNENILAPKIVDLIKRCQQHEVMPVHQPVHQVKVSVIVPNYNHASYLRQRLDSIYQQTYSNFEVILLDDASSDGSQEILKSYAAKMPNTVLVENNSNSGSVFHQWQKGVSLAQGEYIWIAESDDFAAPTFLESLVQIMDKNPNVGLAYAQSNLVDGQGGILGKATGWTADLDSERWSQPFINHGQDEIGKFLIQKNTIPNASAVLLRKTVLLKCGLVDTSFRLCGDWLQWIKVLSQSDIAFVPECLNFWRQNTSNARVASAGTLEWVEGEKVLNYACEILNYSEAEKHNIMLKFLRRCWQWQKEFIEQTAVHDFQIFNFTSKDLETVTESYVDLLPIADSIGNDWIESPYYEDAEKFLYVFWDEGQPFKKLFDQLDLTHVVELACGHGRHGEKLRGKAKKLTMMDINDSNIDFCTQRFQDASDFAVIRNNGVDFQPVPDNSVTSIFCYDAMVHFDHRLILSYLRDTGRILISGGLALYHHSNFPNYSSKHYGQNPHARNYMTQELFRKYATESGLKIREQIVIDWGGEKNLDCITLLEKPVINSISERIKAT